MDIGTIIGDVIAFAILATVILIYFRTKDRKEPLVIVQENDDIKFFLTDDDYDQFSIADIKDDKERIYEEIKKLVQFRSKKLVRFVDRVIIFNSNDKTKEDELFSIIQAAR